MAIFGKNCTGGIFTPPPPCCRDQGYKTLIIIFIRHQTLSKIHKIETLKHLNRNSELKQEAQLLPGDRATRKHAKDC